MGTTVKTTVLLTALSGLLLVIGDLLGGQSGLIISLGMAAVMNVGSYWFSDKIVLAMYRAQPVGPEHPLYQMVERLSRRATHEGSVSDVSRRGLLDADRALRAAGLAAVPLVQILDEVLFEVPAPDVDAAAAIAARAMREAFALEAPLRVGIKVGPTWADLERRPE